VIRPDLGDVHILRRINEETPPQYEEPDEEDRRVQASRVGCVEELFCQGAQEDERDCHARCTDEEKGAAAELVDVQGRPDIPKDGKGRPAGIQEQRNVAGQA